MPGPGNEEEANCTDRRAGFPVVGKKDAKKAQVWERITPSAAFIIYTWGGLGWLFNNHTILHQGWQKLPKYRIGLRLLQKPE
jgi:hypothetical protein